MDLTSLLVASSSVLVAAAVGFLTIRGTRKKLAAEAAKLGAEAQSISVEAALMLVKPLSERIGCLEAEIKELRTEIGEMRKAEEYLQASLHQKDKQLKAATRRIKHLEEVCRKAGINGDEDGGDQIG